MKKLFLGICYITLTHCALAQISGTVTDAADSSALVSATVEIDNSLSLLTNENGYFRISKGRPGTHVLHITAVGYQSFDTSISGAVHVHIHMKRINLFLQPVEVRAIRAGEKAPFTKTNVTKKEIEKLNTGHDLPFLLNQTPSVVINSDAGNGIGYTGIRIRGSDATRINVTLNGIPYNDAESQGTFFVDVPDIASSVSSLQIQRGVGTSSNGAAAFGATINISTNEAITEPYGEINNSYGSFNTWKHTVKAGTGLLNRHFTIDARLSKLSSDGYIDRASTDLHSFYVSGAYLSEKTSIRLNVISGKEKTYQAWYGVPERDLATKRNMNLAGTEKPGDPYDNETDNYQQDHYQLFFNHAINQNLSVNTAFFLTKGKGYYEQYKAAQRFSDYGIADFVAGNDTIHETDLVRQLWLDNDFYGQIFSIQYKGVKGELTFGGGWNRYNGNHFGKIVWAAVGGPDQLKWYDHDAFKTDVNLFGKYQKKLSERLAAFADLQYRRVVHHIDGFRDNPHLKINNSYNFINPRVGITYTTLPYQWYFSYSKGQREPNRDDFETGTQQQPIAEKLHDFELGVERRNSEHSWGATLYYMFYEDQLVLTGKINDVGAYTRINIPNSYRLGLELQGKTIITSWLNASANITLSRNKIQNFIEYYDDYDDGGQKNIAHHKADIAFSPAVIAGAIANFTPVKNTELALLSKYVGRQYLDNTSNRQRSLKPYYTQDARLSYTASNFGLRRITMIAQINNLLNKKYEPNGYTYSYQSAGSFVTENYYYPMAGRNYMIAVHIGL